MHTISLFSIELYSTTQVLEDATTYLLGEQTCRVDNTFVEREARLAERTFAKTFFLIYVCLLMEILCVRQVFCGRLKLHSTQTRRISEPSEIKRDWTFVLFTKAQRFVGFLPSLLTTSSVASNRR